MSTRKPSIIYKGISLFTLRQILYNQHSKQNIFKNLKLHSKYKVYYSEIHFAEFALPRAPLVSKGFKPCNGFKDNLISLGCNKLLSIMNVKVYARFAVRHFMTQP